MISPNIHSVSSIKREERERKRDTNNMNTEIDLLCIFAKRKTHVFEEEKKKMRVKNCSYSFFFENLHTAHGDDLDCFTHWKVNNVDLYVKSVDFLDVMNV